MTDTKLLALNQANKARVRAFWARLDAAAPADVRAAVRDDVAHDLAFFGPDPVNDLAGIDAWLDGFWRPLKRSFPDLARSTFIFMGGQSNGRIDGDLSRDGAMWVSGTGILSGTFERDYLGIPATGKRVGIRWGEFCRIEDGRVSQIYLLLDLIDLLQQAGVEVLPASRGKDGLYPPPRAHDGVLLEPQPEALSRESLEHIRRFIFQGLNSYDRSDLKSMGMRRFFSPGIHWYGPGGIGACLGFPEFEELHQKVWLTAFPDRRVQDLTALIAEGHYSGGPGWAGVKATHAGPYLGCGATKRPIAVNGMDWWKRDGDSYVENWVFVDMIHLFRQFGVDLLEWLPAR